MYKVPTPVQQSQTDTLRHIIKVDNTLLRDNGKALKRVRYILPSLMSMTFIVLIMAVGSYQFPMV